MKPHKSEHDTFIALRLGGIACASASLASWAAFIAMMHITHHLVISPHWPLFYHYFWRYFDYIDMLLFSPASAQMHSIDFMLTVSSGSFAATAFVSHQDTRYIIKFSATLSISSPRDVEAWCYSVFPISISAIVIKWPRYLAAITSPLIRATINQRLRHDEL